MEGSAELWIGLVALEFAPLSYWLWTIYADAQRPRARFGGSWSACTAADSFHLAAFLFALGGLALATLILLRGKRWRALAVVALLLNLAAAWNSMVCF